MNGRPAESLFADFFVRVSQCFLFFGFYAFFLSSFSFFFVLSHPPAQTITKISTPGFFFVPVPLSFTFGSPFVSAMPNAAQC